MVAGSGRRRQWLPFTLGDEPVNLAAGADTRLFIASLADSEGAADFRTFTVQRILLSLMIRATNVFSTMAVGIRFDNEDVPLGTTDPENDMVSDWLYLEQFCTIATEQPWYATRDIRSQRKSRSLNEQLFFYATNKDAVDSVQLHMSGRVLVLLS